MFVATADSVELERLEQIIGGGLKSFYEVGMALAAVQEKGLYKKVLNYKTFKDYCETRWGFGKAYAYRIIASAGVVENLSPIGDILPTHESQVRYLASLNQEDQRGVWRELATESSERGVKITEKMVREAVSRLKNREMIRPKYKVFRGKAKVEALERLSDAMNITTFIISHMERIRDDDPHRQEALTKIIKWCQNNYERRSYR